MPAIADPEVTGFVDGQLRPAADRLAQLYYSLKPVLDHWSSANLGAKIAAGDASLIAMPAGDTRHPVSADNCVGCVQRISAYIADWEANNIAHGTAVMLLAVNPHP